MIKVKLICLNFKFRFLRKFLIKYKINSNKLKIENIHQIIKMKDLNQAGRIQLKRIQVTSLIFDFKIIGEIGNH